MPGEQVVNSCFCCNYKELDKKIESLITKYDVDTIFAESVGSCTDIVATIFNPLLQFRPQLQVTVSTFADAQLLYFLLKDKLKDNKNLFDDDVKYIYYKQIEEAGVIVVSKADLISNQQLEELKQIMHGNYKDKIIHYQNSFNIKNIQEWLKLLNDSKPGIALQSLKIDYDIYGSGEAKLAWLDQEVEINSIDNNAIESTVSLINSIFYKIKEYDYSIGHLKFLINNDTKVSFTAATPVNYAYEVKSPKASAATLLINARVQTTPEMLSKIVSDAIKEEEIKSICKIVVRSLSSFKPGYPKPTYRIPKVSSPTPVPVINIINENSLLLIEEFIQSINKTGAAAYRISIEELVRLYHKSGPGIENILNTLPEFGLVNVEEIDEIDTTEFQNVYQIWVRGVLGLAENGAIWLEKSSIINRLFPFICEHLIIVLDVNMIVADMQQAYAKIKINKEEYGVFLAGSSRTADTKEWLVVGAHSAMSLIVYLIDPQFREEQKPANCSSACCC